MKTHAGAGGLGGKGEVAQDYAGRGPRLPDAEARDRQHPPTLEGGLRSCPELASSFLRVPRKLHANVATGVILAWK